MAPQSSGKPFEIRWWNTVMTGSLDLAATNIAGAALHAWGFLDKVRSLSKVNAIAWDATQMLCPELWAPLAFECECGYVTQSLIGKLRHENIEHAKDRIELARWLWRFEFPYDLFEECECYWHNVFFKNGPVKVFMKETMELFQ